jgi:transposase
LTSTRQIEKKAGTQKAPAEQVVKDIRRATRKQYGAEEKIRIVLEGLRGEESIAGLCRREGIAENLYYNWSKEFLEAGKKRLAGDTVRAATSDEVKQLRRETRDLKEVVAEQTLELRLLKKRMARPDCKRILRCSDQSASTYTVSWIIPWPRWRSAHLEPNKHAGIVCHF